MENTKKRKKLKYEGLASLLAHACERAIMDMDENEVVSLFNDNRVSDSQYIHANHKPSLQKESSLKI